MVIVNNQSVIGECNGRNIFRRYRSTKSFNKRIVYKKSYRIYQRRLFFKSGLINVFLEVLKRILKRIVSYQANLFFLLKQKKILNRIKTIQKYLKQYIISMIQNL